MPGVSDVPCAGVGALRAGLRVLRRAETRGVVLRASRGPPQPT